MQKEIEVRCFCAHEPLLAVCGREIETGTPFIHIKSWRGKRLNVEAVVTHGTVRIRCRECFRWHRLTIRLVEVDSKPEPLPENLKNSMSA